MLKVDFLSQKERGHSTQGPFTTWRKSRKRPVTGQSGNHPLTRRNLDLTFLSWPHSSQAWIKNWLKSFVLTSGNERKETYFSFSLPSWEHVCGQCLALISLFHKDASLLGGPHCPAWQISQSSWGHTLDCSLSPKPSLRAANMQELLVQSSAHSNSMGAGSQATTACRKYSSQFLKPWSLMKIFTLLRLANWIGWKTKKSELFWVALFILTLDCIYMNYLLNQGNI